jgi:hypothetical protein
LAANFGPSLVGFAFAVGGVNPKAGFAANFGPSLIKFAFAAGGVNPKAGFEASCGWSPDPEEEPEPMIDASACEDDDLDESVDK